MTFPSHNPLKHVTTYKVTQLYGKFDRTHILEIALLQAPQVGSDLQRQMSRELQRASVENAKLQAASGVKDLEKLLQDMDVNRLRAVIYRDVVSGNFRHFLRIAMHTIYLYSLPLKLRYMHTICKVRLPDQHGAQMFLMCHIEQTELVILCTV